MADPSTTTWMIRGLAPESTPAEVAADLDSLGFTDRYDYLYLPGGRAGSKGYCFVNFTAPEDAAGFSACVDEGALGLRLGGREGRGVWVRPAKVQGLQANLGHLLRARKADHWRKTDVRPWVRSAGTMQPAFPVAEMRAEEKDLVPRTLMLRGIPNKMTSVDVMDALDALGFDGDYDYFYLPCDVRSLCNKGYAFVNLVSEQVMPAFMALLNGHRFASSQSVKTVEVSLAKHQGVRANLLRCSSVNCAALLSYPWVLDDGEMKCLSVKQAVRDFARRLPGKRGGSKSDGSTAASEEASSDEDAL